MMRTHKLMITVLATMNALLMLTVLAAARPQSAMAATTHVLTIPATAFTPTNWWVNQWETFTFVSGDLLGQGIYNADFYLPAGSTLDNVTMIAIDQSSYDLCLRLFLVTPDTVSATELGSTCSGGTTRTWPLMRSFIPTPYVVDELHALVLSADFDRYDYYLRLNAVRVTYTAP